MKLKIKDLSEKLRFSFEFNPVLRITSNNPQLIFERICESPHATETPKDFIHGEVRYLNSKTLGCTPIQAYLLEYNLGYQRL
jgi:hypothetical protein